MHDRKNLPLRSGNNGVRIDTRPMYIEEWLDNLPYMNFRTTSELLFKATRFTNEQRLKPATRMELVELYNRPYQYYIDSQIKAGAQHTLQSIESSREQIKVLKRIAINLAKACNIAAEDALNRKSLWGQSKPPVSTFFLALNYLSHALIFGYLEYSPTPKNVWKEINFIYDFAESLGQENAGVRLPDSLALHGVSTVSQAYIRILMTSLADPHHLPYGAIWEIYEQLTSWVSKVSIDRLSSVPEPENRFVVRLDTDLPPIPVNKFNHDQLGDRHRFIDVSSLMMEIETQLEKLNLGHNQDKSLILSPYFSKLILEHLIMVWGIPPKRQYTRKKRTGSIRLACGLEPVFYFLNGEQAFMPPTPENPDDEAAGLESGRSAGNRKYELESWDLIDQNMRGLAVIKNIRPIYNVRVGEPVIINTGTGNSQWAVGIIRWMMIREGQIYKIGVQILSLSTVPVSVRACNGSLQDTRFRPGLLALQGENQSILASKGLYIINREIEIVYKNMITKTRVTGLLESSPGFEQFSIHDRIH